MTRGVINLTDTEYNIISFVPDGVVLEYFDTYIEQLRQELWIPAYPGSQGELIFVGGRSHVFSHTIRPKDHLSVED